MPAHSKFSQELFDAICERIAAGETLSAICRDKGMPTKRTFDLWCAANPELAKRKAEAREAGEEAILDECIDIADDSRNDWVERENKRTGGTYIALNEEAVQRSKMRIWTRLELLKKWNPKKWGDKVQHGGADDLPPMRVRSERELTEAELEAIARGASNG